MAPASSRTRLSHPTSLVDLLLYRLNGIRAVGGGIVLRLCEGRFGVTRREWVVLALLQAAGPVHSSALAEQANLDRSAMSKAIVSLIRKGLVSRVSRRGDRRFTELSLTDAGTALFERMMPVMEDLNARVLGVLDVREIAVLDGLLDRLQTSVHALERESAPWPAADRRRGGRLDSADRGR